MDRVKLFFEDLTYNTEYTFLEEAKDMDSIIAKALDALYLEVSDILDIHIYSYHGKIKIYPNKEDVESNVATALKKQHAKKTDFPAVYRHSLNTIYASFPDLTLGMLAHEIAHAILSHYFVVPPPTKIQEVLAGYVEYTIRKSTGTLPPKR